MEPHGRLSLVGQGYVLTVALVATAGLLLRGEGWYVALVVLALPLSLVALWVAFYAGLALGLALGHDPTHLSWPVGLVWVAIWTMTAWVNARMVEQVLERGWARVLGRPRSREPLFEEESW